MLARSSLSGDLPHYPFLRPGKTVGVSDKQVKLVRHRVDVRVQI
jgi:hypothetical protein